MHTVEYMLEVVDVRLIWDPLTVKDREWTVRKDIIERAGHRCMRHDTYFMLKLWIIELQILLLKSCLDVLE